MTSVTSVAGPDRRRLVGMASRMLGTVAAGEDVVQWHPNTLTLWRAS